MKLLGKNSMSTALSCILFLLFLFFAFHLIYELFGYGISYYNLKTNSKILYDTFYVGNTIDWGGKIATGSNYFRFKYPFSDQQMVTGVFSLNMFLNYLLQFSFYTLFFFSAFKIFNGMSQEILFNQSVIEWLKRFSILNILFVPLSVLNWLYNFKSDLNMDILLIVFIHLLLGIMVYFIVAFFKKGFELQSENDLTI
ncbi:hypothetical protein ASG22_19455 [Chryseobacterium sp. Leaf405]|uniref:DUF2975 domain-containing protein n=1 Tax=Chryseobacterium sp. Leaf405 TaxID=1736367 RepID=UPI0006F417E5|nr:DUF2975 domain-containing protein [Chryseobacterium sp. Leaf405]KQT30874.1 hypothetical protein ASG22_19455 [Chryseobacterium sp. Leaf405]